MVKPMPIEKTEDVRWRWRQWTQIVRFFALQNPRRFAVDPDEYRELHTGMLAQCRAMAGQKESPHAPRLGELEEILTPWTSLDALELADPGIVRQLLCRCTMAERMFDGRWTIRGNWPRVGSLLLGAGLLAGLAALLMSVGSARSLLSPELLQMQHWVRLVWNAVSHNDAQQRLLVGGTAAVLATIVVVWRSARRT